MKVTVKPFRKYLAESKRAVRPEGKVRVKPRGQTVGAALYFIRHGFILYTSNRESGLEHTPPRRPFRLGAVCVHGVHARRTRRTRGPPRRLPRVTTAPVTTADAQRGHAPRYQEIPGDTGRSVAWEVCGGRHRICTLYFKVVAL